MRDNQNHGGVSIRLWPLADKSWLTLHGLVWDEDE